MQNKKTTVAAAQKTTRYKENLAVIFGRIWPSCWNDLKCNWFFSISAAAFFYLEVQMMVYYYSIDNYIIGIGLASGASVLVAAFAGNIRKFLKQCSLGLKNVSFFTAVGICLYGAENFIKRETEFFTARGVDAVPVICAVLAVYFVYVCIAVFWKKLNATMQDAAVFRDIAKGELLVYGLLLVATFCYVTALFMQTEAFYTTKVPYDVIYTSDSSDFMILNPYVMLMHHQNDLRQPLFAVFSAPFLGIPYLISSVFFDNGLAEALMVTYVQVLILMLSNLMLAKMLRTTAAKRVCFMVAMCSTYSYLLFVLMLEQYIMAYFYLILFFYLYCEKNRASEFALYGAGGSLLTSLILMPLMSRRLPWKDFWGWFEDMANCGARFAVLMLCFCRYGIFYSLMGYVNELSRWTGVRLSMSGRIFQYTEFINSCLFAPPAGVENALNGWYSWQLLPAEGIRYAAVVILLLAAAGFVCSRNKRVSQFAMGWILFSVIMLVGLGWGTKENGLILYALYFGWAFVVLLFQLVDYAGEKLQLRFLAEVATIGFSVVAFAVNIPAILKIVHFGMQYYPS